MPDLAENLTPDQTAAATTTPPETTADNPVNNDNDNYPKYGKTLRDALGSETDTTSDNGSNIPNFNVATEEEVQNYIKSLPNIDNADIYKDLNIGNEAFSDLPQKLMEAKIPPAQIKPLLEYWDNKLADIVSQQTSEEDYDQKLHKYLGNDFDKYQPLTDQQLIKYVPKELAESMKFAPNDVMVAAKMAIAGTIKEYEALVAQIKDDYGVDPNKYKIGSLGNGRANVDGERAALTKEIWDLKVKGDFAGVERKSAELRRLMGFKENADY